MVVNISTGWHAGGHDGTSLLEHACDVFTDNGREPGRVIVKSAGNRDIIQVAGKPGTQLQERHAQFSIKQGSSKVLSWVVGKDHTSPDEIEVWFDSCDELEFTVIPPTGNPVKVTRQAPPPSPTTVGSYSCSITYDRYHAYNGDGQFALTVRPPQHGSLKGGEEWRLLIEGKSVRSKAIVHAWINGNDDNRLTFEAFGEDETTLTMPGTARSVITVASVESTPLFQVASHSCYGPTRDGREKPEVAAPGVDIA